jgi:hypothetical protein
MNTKQLNLNSPVLPNFIKGLAIVGVSALSLSAFAGQYGDTEDKMAEAAEVVAEEVNATDVMEPITDIDAYKDKLTAEGLNLSDEEIEAMWAEEQRNAEMKKLMEEGEEAAPE